MEAFPHNLYGYPQAAAYGVKTQLDVSRVVQGNGHVRQRRRFIHNPSASTLQFRLKTAKARALMDWMLTQKDEWFLMDLISGNDSAANCAVYPTQVKQITDFSLERVPATDLFLINFEVETREQTNYLTYHNASKVSIDRLNFSETGLKYSNPGTPFNGITVNPTVSRDFPAGLPLPLASGFTQNIGRRKASQYLLTYQFNTKQLKTWLAFAGSFGTSWFLHFMVSVTKYGEPEIIRYTSDPDQKLIGPDLWEISIEAETQPIIKD